MEHYLGQKLKMLREERGLSQRELGKKLNKGISTISGYESDAHSIPLDVLISLAAIYDISLDELIGLKKPDSVSIQGLSEFQIMILRDLRNEFSKPTNQTGNLSDKQMEILHDIIQAFSKSI